MTAIAREIAVAGVLSWGLVSAAIAGEAVDFNRDIRPLLSDNCFHCHGPDAAERQADLALHEQHLAQKAVGPGRRDESALYQRVTSADPDLVMPPPDSGRQLTPDQQELLGRWIDQGAPWSTHWSWRPLERPATPEPPRRWQAPVRNPIDAFLQQRLRTENLEPSAEAPREALIRRATLDLTGLPPTPEEVAAFVEDRTENAWENVVDRLLASPAYGERMAWDWLDAARYADSNGYQGDGDRTMWPWRDWVVHAFNRNLPWDEFTLWQLAGDLLPQATHEQRLATGFCRNHMINGEGGRIAEENRIDYVMDMTETMGTLWLGLTLNCCRCHDHKFDSLTHRDYYGLFALFNQTPVTGAGGSGQTAPALATPTPEQQAELAAAEAALHDVVQVQEQRSRELAATLPAWLQSRREALREEDLWQIFEPTAVRDERRHGERNDDGLADPGGGTPAHDAHRLLGALPAGPLAALRLVVLRQPADAGQDQAPATGGDFLLTEIELHLRRKGVEQPLRIASAAASYEHDDRPIAAAFDGDPLTGWGVGDDRPVDREHVAVFRLAEPLLAEAGDELSIRLRHRASPAGRALERFRLATASLASAGPQPPTGSELREALAIENDRQTEAQRLLLSQAQRSDDAAWQRLEGGRRAADEQLTALRDAVAKVMVMEDQPQRRTTHVLQRGLYNRPGPALEASAPAGLPPMEEEPSRTLNRLDLARWLVSERNPLTARVTVNRFWQQVFGTGLVKTTDDFGVQGEAPSHPELLDWLAADFRDAGWDVKRLMRLMVTSHAYRQSSIVTAEHLERDPENRLLARAPRYRLPSWMLRDQALAVSGLLSPRKGGPPVNVYQPPGVWEEATFGERKYVQDHGESLYRRSLYVFWRRIIGPTMFFDNASRQTCTVRTVRTNTPLHALLASNDTAWLEAARVLAERTLREEGGDVGRLAHVYRRVLCRPPKAAEQEILLAALQRSRSHYRHDAAAAAALLGAGEAPRAESPPADEHAAWTTLCLGVLNLDESLTKQ